MDLRQLYDTEYSNSPKAEEANGCDSQEEDAEWNPIEGTGREPLPKRRQMGRRSRWGLGLLSLILALFAGLVLWQIFGDRKPPSYVLNIPNLTAFQGQLLDGFDLDNFIETEALASTVRWKALGTPNIGVSINEDHVVSLGSLSPSWYGNDTITFEATFPNGTVDEDQVMVQVKGPVLTSYDDFATEIDSGHEVYVLFELDDVADYDKGAIWAYSTTPRNSDRPYDICLSITRASEQSVQSLLDGRNYIGPFPITRTQSKQLPMISCRYDELKDRIEPDAQ